MNTDRELLELAAKAAGIEYQFDNDGDVIEYFGGGLQLAFDGGKWNPLTDDGDALRLAVKLEFGIAVFSLYVEVTDGLRIDESEKTDQDPYAATRRAIVRAAAEIGKTMP